MVCHSKLHGKALPLDRASQMTGSLDLSNSDSQSVKEVPGPRRASSLSASEQGVLHLQLCLVDGGLLFDL